MIAGLQDWDRGRGRVMGVGGGIAYVIKCFDAKTERSRLQKPLLATLFVHANRP
jgi:cephalosporin-C deacetylase-like acetyl esterase